MAAEAARYRRVIVFTKCGKPPVLPRASANVEFVPSPNVGSNDYAIIHHILREYAANGLADVTVFCEGGEHRMCTPDAILRPRTVHPTKPWIVLDDWKKGAAHPEFGAQDFRYPWTNEMPPGLQYFNYKTEYKFAVRLHASKRDPLPPLAHR